MIALYSELSTEVDFIKFLIYIYLIKIKNYILMYRKHIVK